MSEHRLGAECVLHLLPSDGYTALPTRCTIKACVMQHMFTAKPVCLVNPAKARNQLLLWFACCAGAPSAPQQLG